MRKIIHHIRKQPESTKRHLLHIFTVIATVFLLFLWIYSLGSKIGNDVGKDISKKLAPISVLKDNLIGGYQDISDLNN